jgi:Aspartyl protease
MTKASLGIGVLLAPLLVSPAALAAGAPEPPPEAVVAELPFQPGEGNRIILDLATEGAQPFLLFLDTGAVASVITPLMARQLNVSVRRQKASPYRRSTRVGKDLQFWIDTTSSDTGSQTGWEVGLLGADFYDDFVLELDFQAKRVRFLSRRKFTVPKETDDPAECVLPIRLVAGRIAVPIELGGQEFQALFDTGDPTAVTIDGKTAAKLKLDVDALPDFGRVGFWFGSTQSKLWEAPSFRFAGLGYELMPVMVLPHGAFNLGLPDEIALGYDVMKHFRIRIDYPRRRMWLRQVPDQPVTFIGADYQVARRIGAFLVPGEDQYHVWRIAPGGAAARYGLREDDRIVAPVGDKLLSPREVATRIEARGELTVARQQGDAWVDLVLPEMASGPPDAEAPAP